jgi:hypothetical protein
LCGWLAVAVALVVGRPAAADGQTVAVVGLANNAGLSEAEVDFLTDVVVSAFRTLPSDRFEVVLVELANAQECDDPCRIRAARDQGAAFSVTGSIVLFGAGYAASLKLHDVAADKTVGSETTEMFLKVEDLLGATKNAAAELRAELEQLATPAAAPAPMPAPPPKPAPRIDGEPEHPAVGTLRLTTDPPGASIYIGGTQRTDGDYAGKSPLEKNLKPRRWWVVARAKHHHGKRAKVRIFAGDTFNLHLKLRRDYPANPYKIWGHASLWLGVAAIAPGIAFALGAKTAAKDYKSELDQDDRDRSQRLAGGMWASFGASAALITTGAVLLALSPGDKAYFEKQRLSGGPTADGNGLTMAYSRWF